MSEHQAATRSTFGWRMLPLVLAALAVPAACGGSVAQGSNAGRDFGREPARGPRPGASATAPASPPIRLRAVSGELVIELGRGITVAKALESAHSIVEKLGGFVFEQESLFAGPGTASVTYKIPPDRLGDAVAELSTLGEPTRSAIDTADVTDAVIDLDARIRSAEASVVRVRELMGDAGNLGELTTLEAELTRRETTLEQLTGQRRQTVGAVELSTLTLVLSGDGHVEPTNDGDGWLASVPGFGAALASGWAALVAAARVVGAGLGYALPFVGVAVGALGARRLARRRSKSRDGEI